MLHVEDLHWADNESLDFLNYLADVNKDVAMLILGFSRPTLFERRSDWNTTAVYRRIDLAPLDPDTSRLFADELLKKVTEVPPALRDLVTNRAEGNPFYMEELIKMLIDQGAIVAKGETWTVDVGKLTATNVPAALTGILQARLDSLPPAEKVTLQEASVIGPVFWDQALFALDERTRHTLPALVRRDLAVPRVDSVSTELREYAFQHQLLNGMPFSLLVDTFLLEKVIKARTNVAVCLHFSKSFWRLRANARSSSGDNDNQPKEPHP